MQLAESVCLVLPSGRDRDFVTSLQSRFNFGAGTKSLSSMWYEMLVGGTPLVSVGITNRDKRVASQRLFLAMIDAGF
jgi:hypothetical protein